MQNTNSFLPTALAVTGIGLTPGHANEVSYSDIVYSDVAPTCVVSQDDFKGWGGATATGATFTAPDSANFVINHSCDFYKWAAQAFLWMTSTDGADLVLDGPSFYTVGHLDASGNRALVAHDVTPPMASIRTPKPELTGDTSNDEIGQAGGGAVLMTAEGDLVFYELYVNTGLAYFRSLFGDVAAGAYPATYPIRASDMAAVTGYRAGRFPNATDSYDASQLTIEIKSSWVAADSLPDASSYITKTVNVPRVDTSASLPWAFDDNTATSKEMALLGMHVVGTIKDHPEFVWATFEHFQNAPNAPYYLMENDGTISLREDPMNKDYRLFKSGGTPAPNYSHCLSLDTTNSTIVAAYAGSTPPSYCDDDFANVLRRAPWGNLANDASASTLRHNTMIVSLNNSLRQLMTDDTTSAVDVRSNYIQTGNIWTNALSGETVSPIPDDYGTYATQMRGSLLAANMTMETFTQGTNCFSCHQLTSVDGSSFAPGSLSHIYTHLAPLTPIAGE